MNPYTFAENITKAADEIAHRTNTELVREEIAVMLVMLEICLDKSRAVPPAGTGSLFPEEKRNVEEKLDELRVNIRNLLLQIDKAKFQETKRQIISAIETNFKD